VPKTGTTALQHNFFMRCPGIRYVGKPQSVVSEPAIALVRAIAALDQADWASGLAAQTARAAQLVETSQYPIVISDEELSAGALLGKVDRRTIAERLKALFPDATIVLVIRNQLTALPSLYSYAMTMPGVPRISFAAWLEQLRGAGPLSRGLQLFEYAELAEIYTRLFGRDGVVILLYEEFRDHYERFIARLAECVGIDTATALSLPNTRMNSRMPINVELDAAAEHEEFIRDYYAPGNRRLSEVYGIDVRRLGYPH